MIDIHTHIIPGIDDGSKSIEETLEMINEARNAGFTDIITTSHYIDGHSDINKFNRELLINGIQSVNKTDVKLYNGAEAYITPDLLELYNGEQIPTLANSRYVLFELPMNSEVLYTYSIIEDLINNNYVPIIAHPERYRFVQKNIKKAYELIDRGALLQCNYGSFIGLYGNDAQKTVVKLLKEDKISFLGSDTHRANSIYTKIEDVVRKLEKTVGFEKVQDITTNNPRKIIDNEYI